MKRRLLFAFVTLFVAEISGGAVTAPVPGTIIFRDRFETPESHAAWSEARCAAWEAKKGDATQLCVTVPEDQKKAGNMVSRPIDLSPWRGCKILVSCRVRAQGVSQPSASYLGVKVMLHYTTPSAGPSWHNENNIHGTFDWRTLSFLVDIAPDAEMGTLSLGLQDSFGTAWFDDLCLSVISGPRPPRPSPPIDPGPVFRGHELPRLRGVMSPSSFRDDDLNVLGEEWNANVIRWQLTRNWGKSGTERDLVEYTTWIDGKLDEFDEVLEACQRYGLLAVIDLHSPPGGRYQNKDMAMFFEQKYQDYFVSLWERIALRYKGRPALWGYDLINEPTQTKPSPDGIADALGTQVLAAQAVRRIDPEIPIFITSSDWGSPAGFRELDPVDVSNVIYQVHLYTPHAFTHQGVNDKWDPVMYPGEIAGEVWNRDRLRKELEPVREFQLAYNVHIYVGEFSAIRWAPGAVDYLRDCIELFEEYEWDWTYHAYREWDGWSLEHGVDLENRRPVDAPTDRKQLMLDWFDRNKKP